MLPSPKDVFISQQMKIHNDKWKVHSLPDEEYIKFLEYQYKQLRDAVVLSYDLLITRCSSSDWHSEWFVEDVDKILQTIKTSYDRTLEEIFEDDKEGN